MRQERLKPIENFFFGFLETEASRISNEFSEVLCKIHVFYPPDSEPQYGYFCISLECILHKAASENADLISMGIEVDDHDNKFKITADLSWGNPYARTIERVFVEPAEVTEENLEIIKENLPHLFVRMREEIRANPRGKAHKGR